MTELERCLRAGRKDKKLTQGELAQMAGVTRNDIIRLESGIFADLDPDALRRIAGIAGIDAGMFQSMYCAAFRPELKNRSSKPSAPVEGIMDQPSHPGQKNKPGDLADLEKAIMDIPLETRSGLIITIRMLVRAAAVTALQS